MLITETNIEKAKQLINKSKGKEQIIVQALDAKYNRSLIEYGKFDYLLLPEPLAELKNKKDKIKQLDLGFSSIIGRIATKNKVSLLIDLEPMRKLETKQKALVLGRLREIIKLARKTKTKIKFKACLELKNHNALFSELGASSHQMKVSV